MFWRHVLVTLPEIKTEGAGGKVVDGARLVGRLEAM